jgi:hypothetical protein
MTHLKPSLRALVLAKESMYINVLIIRFFRTPLKPSLRALALTKAKSLNIFPDFNIPFFIKAPKTDSPNPSQGGIKIHTIIYFLITR